MRRQAPPTRQTQIIRKTALCAAASGAPIQIVVGWLRLADTLGHSQTQPHGGHHASRHSHHHR